MVNCPCKLIRFPFHKFSVSVGGDTLIDCRRNCLFQTWPTFRLIPGLVQSLHHSTYPTSFRVVVRNYIIAFCVSGLWFYEAIASRDAVQFRMENSVSDLLCRSCSYFSYAESLLPNANHCDVFVSFHLHQWRLSIRHRERNMHGSWPLGERCKQTQRKQQPLDTGLNVFNRILSSHNLPFWCLHLWPSGCFVPPSSALARQGISFLLERLLFISWIWWQSLWLCFFWRFPTAWSRSTITSGPCWQNLHHASIVWHLKNKTKLCLILFIISGLFWGFGQILKWPQSLRADKLDLHFTVASHPSLNWLVV